ncbi:protein ALP1-like [Folsomia candida]|uniref:Putative nuclease HARBI1 n=1 Tax=Folsomia candida TaxID=158441 RepID=A0A226DE27_FOLCA|nr:protein ALP1-like [Folsomia candida]OXA43423.1 putative nuclease HARBI1 [Folsomia candida]
MPSVNRELALKILLLRRIRRRLKRKPRQLYMRKIFEQRLEHGDGFLAEQLREDPQYHQLYFRMNKENYDEIYNLVCNEIQGKNTHLRPVSAHQKLAITLRYLATGNTQMEMAFSYRVSPQSVSVILREVMMSICSKLGPLHLKKPMEENWKDNEAGFRELWDYPNACGAMDGKHIRIRSPAHSGSTNYNYKNFYSIVLLAIVGPDYKFTAVDIGASGSQSDGGVFGRSSLGNALHLGKLGLPPPKQVGETCLPHVILTDDAFSLKPNAMKPFPGEFLPAPQRVFNYRLSRGRMVVENAFGILSARWRIFHAPINADPELTKLIVRCAVILHNFLISKKDLSNITTDGPQYGETGNWREETVGDTGMERLQNENSDHPNLSGGEVREEFCRYFNNEGAVD